MVLAVGMGAVDGELVALVDVSAVVDGGGLVTVLDDGVVAGGAVDALGEGVGEGWDGRGGARGGGLIVALDEAGDGEAGGGEEGRGEVDGGLELGGDAAGGDVVGPTDEEGDADEILVMEGAF